MAKDCSFDVVSEFDQQELVNAVDQTCRDLTARYDLKDSNSTVTLEKDSIAINTTDEYSLNSIFEILAIKVTKRGLSPLILERGKVEESLGGRVREHVKLRRGIETDLAKKSSLRSRAPSSRFRPAFRAIRSASAAKTKTTCSRSSPSCGPRAKNGTCRSSLPIIARREALGATGLTASLMPSAKPPARQKRATPCGKRLVVTGAGNHQRRFIRRARVVV